MDKLKKLAKLNGVPILVVIITLAVGIGLYSYFLANARHLWTSMIHDRNVHYWLGLQYALDFRTGDLFHFIYDLHRARVRPPLYSLLVGATQAMGGIDYRWAALPSLAGWIMAVVFGFLAARRAVPRGGNWAGLTAALFILMSPAQRAFAIDVMQESLGAGLTMLTLYLYLVARQEPTRRTATYFALGLSSLFFLKYNYWLLVFATLVGVTIAGYGRGPWIELWGRLREVDWNAFFRKQARSPLNYVIVGLVLTIGYLILMGGESVHIFGVRISTRRPMTLVYYVYLAFLLKMWPWWWKAGREQVNRLPAIFRQMAYWHVLPAGLWMMWPERLYYFLWFIGPANEGEVPHQDWFGGWTSYSSYVISDYHYAGWSAALATALAGVALLFYRRLRTGSTAIIAFVILSTLLTFHHTNRKSRFLHSWLPAGWVLSGIGLVQAANCRRRLFNFHVGPWLAAAGVGGLIVAHYPGITTPGHSPEGGPKPKWPSTMDIADAFLRETAGSRGVAVVSNLHNKFYLGWTVLHQHGRTIQHVTELEDFGIQSTDQEGLNHWARTSPWDTLVIVNVNPDSFFHVPCPVDDSAKLTQILSRQTTFKLKRRIEFAEEDCEVIIWKRELNSPGNQVAAH